MNNELSELKAREEAKRERNWNAAERWRVIQETITWAAEQATVRRNTPAACRKKEAEILAGMKRAGMDVTGPTPLSGPSLVGQRHIDSNGEMQPFE